MIYRGPEPSSQDEVMSLEMANNLLSAKGSNPTPLDYAKQQTADFIKRSEVDSASEDLRGEEWLVPFSLNYAAKSKSFLAMDRGAISRVNFPSQDNFSGIYPNTWESSYIGFKDPGNQSHVDVTEIDLTRFKLFNNFALHCKWVAKVDTYKAIQFYADFYPNETTHWTDYSIGVAFREASSMRYIFGAAALRVYIDPSNPKTQKLKLKAQFLNGFDGAAGISGNGENFVKFAITPMRA